MSDTKYIYHPGSGRDPEEMEMLAATYGWKFESGCPVNRVYDRPPYDSNAPKLGGGVVTLSLCLFFLFLFCSRSEAVVIGVGGVTITYSISGSTVIGSVVGPYDDTGGPTTVKWVLEHDDSSGTYQGDGGFYAMPGGTGFSYSFVPGDTFGVSLYTEDSMGGAVFVSKENAAIATGSTHVNIAINANNTDKDITYRLMDGGGNVVSTFTQASGAGVVIQSFNTTGFSGPFSVVSDQNVQAVKDSSTGVWTASPDAHVFTTTNSGVTAVAGGPETAPTTNISNPTVVPQAPSNSVTDDNTKAIWVPQANVETTDSGAKSDFTIAAYREGVDKILSALKPEANTASLPDIQDNSGQSDLVGLDAGVIPSTDLFGTPPVLSPTLDDVSTIAVAFDIPKPGGVIHVSKTVDFHDSQYSTGIALMRAIELVILTLGFFIVSVKTVRGAFAGK